MQTSSTVKYLFQSAHVIHDNIKPCRKVYSKPAHTNKLFDELLDLPSFYSQDKVYSNFVKTNATNKSTFAICKRREHETFTTSRRRERLQLADEGNNLQLAHKGNNLQLADEGNT